MAASTMIHETSVALRGRVDGLRAGDWVEVRQASEILATLDADGRLDGMPFMPEMLQFCGRRFPVMATAHKTCDTVNRTGGRRVESAVHLDELRCDGRAHGGCDAGCLLFWRTEWLRSVDGPGSSAGATSERPTDGSTTTGAMSIEQLHEATIVDGRGTDDPTYACQATHLPEFTAALPWWDLRQYLRDWRSGNVEARTLLSGAVYVVVYNVIRRADRPWIRLRSRLIGWYDAVQRRRGGVPYPRRRGQVPDGTRTPGGADLGLQPGDLVRIKTYDEILATLDGNNRNRGMFFDAEEVPYCGTVQRVRNRVERIVEERTGKLIDLRGGSVVLDEVWCKGHFSDRRMFCPRAIYPFWRDAWLERVEAPTARAGDDERITADARR
jgi:hypothetical protein